MIAFARMLLTGVYKQNEAPAECGTRPENASSHCMHRGVGRLRTRDRRSDPSGSDFGFFDIRLVR